MVWCLPNIKSACNQFSCCFSSERYIQTFLLGKYTINCGLGPFFVNGTILSFSPPFFKLLADGFNGVFHVAYPMAFTTSLTMEQRCKKQPKVPVYRKSSNKYNACLNTVIFPVHGILIRGFSFRMVKSLKTFMVFFCQFFYIHFQRFNYTLQAIRPVSWNLQIRTLQSARNRFLP